MTPARSYLFVPGNRADRFDKAWEAGADAVIIDLEDAVPPQDKPVARAALVDWLSDARPVYVRVNAADTPWFDDDIAACASAGVAGVMLPKAEDADAIRALVARCHRVVVPLIETAKGFADLRTLSEQASVLRVAFGSIDFQVDLGIEGDDLELLFFRSQLVLASRLANIQPPVDGISVAIDDTDLLRADTLKSRRLGFGAKLCIHPHQLAVVNASFRPTDDEIRWARRVVDAMSAAKGAVVSVDGKMVDRPVLAKAERIMREAGVQ